MDHGPKSLVLIIGHIGHFSLNFHAARPGRRADKLPISLCWCVSNLVESDLPNLGLWQSFWLSDGLSISFRALVRHYLGDNAGKRNPILPVPLIDFGL